MQSVVFFKILAIIYILQSDVSDNDEYENRQDNDILVVINTSVFVEVNNGRDNSVIFCVVRGYRIALAARGHRSGCSLPVMG